jgi:hypothetical protein
LTGRCELFDAHRHSRLSSESSGPLRLFLRGVYGRVLAGFGFIWFIVKSLWLARPSLCVSSLHVSKRVCDFGRPVVARWVARLVEAKTQATSLARGQHVPNNADQSSVLHSSCNALFITELLVDSISGGVGAFLQTHINAEARR